MKTFEEYLKEKHSEYYMGTDDDMPVKYFRWLDRQNLDDIIKYSQEWHDSEIKNLENTIKDLEDRIEELELYV